MAIAGVKRERRKRALIAAYENYARDPRTINDLFQQVTKFAFTKVRHLEHEFRTLGSSETADDWAQNIALIVWKELPKFRGDAEAFYPWVHKICFNEASRAFNELKEQKETMLPLFVAPEEDESGEEPDEEENPAIYQDVYQREWRIHIPDSIQGVDLAICELIMDDKSYAEIGQLLGITEGTIKMRLLRMRKFFQKAGERPSLLV